VALVVEWGDVQNIRTAPHSFGRTSFMADLGFLLLTLAVFGVLALAAKGAERL
jgi:hypothetical protein